MSNRKEGRKWRENTNQKAPDGFSRLEVFEKAATKKDDHNHRHFPARRKINEVEQIFELLTLVHADIENIKEEFDLEKEAKNTDR